MGSPSYEDLMDLYQAISILDVGEVYVFNTANGNQVVVKRTQ
jgi:hypothetical protein